MDTAESPRSPLWPALRFVLGLALAVALGYAAVILAFVGIVLFSGCFWACSDPNPQPLLGMLAIAGAAAAGGGVVTSLVAGVAGRRASLRTVFFWSCAAAVVLLGIGLGNT